MAMVVRTVVTLTMVVATVVVTTVVAVAMLMLLSRINLLDHCVWQALQKLAQPLKLLCCLGVVWVHDTRKTEGLPCWFEVLATETLCVVVAHCLVDQRYQQRIAAENRNLGKVR